MIVTHNRMEAPHANTTALKIEIAPDAVTVNGDGVVNGKRIQTPVTIPFPHAWVWDVNTPVPEGAVRGPMPTVWMVVVEEATGAIFLVDGNDYTPIWPVRSLKHKNHALSIAQAFFWPGTIGTQFTDANWHCFYFGPWIDAVHGPRRHVLAHGDGTRNFYRVSDGLEIDEHGQLINDPE